MISLDSIFSQSSSIENLIQQYMAIESRPVTDLQTRKSDLTIRRAMYSDLANYLESVFNHAEDLADTEDDSIFNTINVSSSNSSIISATSSAGAALGTYQFRVRQLATATGVKSTADLNTAKSTSSTSQVVAGSDTLDTSQTWEEAGFDTVPDGSVTINGKEFTLADYDTVDEFMDAVNEDEDASATIYYDSTRDKFFIENDSTSGDLSLSETPESVGFLSEINISEGVYDTNNSGLQTDVYLYQTNFDSEVDENDSGSFKINGSTITWDADDDTLNDIISSINNSDAGVTVFYDDTLDKLIMTANESGSEEIELEDVSGTFLMNTLKFSGASQTTGQDALFTINSTSADDEITKSSNTFTINGITYTLKDVTVENDSYSDAGTTYVTVTTSKNASALQAKINAFLGSLNTAFSYIKAKSAVNTDTYTRGALAGETAYTTLKNALMGILLDQVDGLDEDKPSTLAEIGITVNDGMSASISDASKLIEWLLTCSKVETSIRNFCV